DAVTMPASSSFRTRAAGVAMLNAVPVADLRTEGSSALISLLEREATGQVAYNEVTADGDESWSEYIGDLSFAVLRLNDPRSLRGLALLGIETGRDAQEYVASLGAAALPALDEAWQLKATVRPDVIITWGSLLAVTGTNALSASDRTVVLSHVGTALSDYGVAVATAARRGSIVVLAPALLRIAAGSSGIV